MENDPLKPVFELKCKDASGNEYDNPNLPDPCPQPEKKSMFSRMFGRGGKSRRHKKSFRKTMKKSGGKKNAAQIHARINATRSMSARTRRMNKRGYGGKNNTRKRMKGGIIFNMGFLSNKGSKSAPSCSKVCQEHCNYCNENSICPVGRLSHKIVSEAVLAEHKSQGQSFVKELKSDDIALNYAGKTISAIKTEYPNTKLGYCDQCKKVILSGSTEINAEAIRI